MCLELEGNVIKTQFSVIASFKKKIILQPNQMADAEKKE